MKYHLDSVSRLLYHSVVIRTEASLDKFHHILKEHHGARHLDLHDSSLSFFSPSFVKSITISMLYPDHDKSLPQLRFAMEVLELREICLGGTRRIPFDESFLCQCPPRLSLNMEVDAFEASITLPSPNLLGCNLTHLELINYSLHSEVKIPSFPNLKNVLMYTYTADDIAGLVQRARVPLPAAVRYSFSSWFNMHRPFPALLLRLC